MSKIRKKQIVGLFISILILIFPMVVSGDGGGITFTNIADDPNTGLSYSKTRTAMFALTQAARDQSLITPLTLEESIFIPAMGANGLPGIAIFDYDGDNDLDIYVSNGPGAANSLFSNQLEESGLVEFIDVAVAAGVDATDQDSFGVCFGDIDNDGDADLAVLGHAEANRLFSNNGNGTFTHLANSGIEGSAFTAASCAMGDVDGDGLLDIFVGNAFDLSTQVPLFFEPFAQNQPNQLFKNNGNNTFSDISQSSGILNLGGLPPNSSTITWAVALVDIDLDGDVDIIHADDQGAMPTTLADPVEGVDRGYIHVLLNNGSGQFVDNPIVQSPFAPGDWMGLGFGDLNCDGHLDLFASNFGDYGFASLGVPPPHIAGFNGSRWFLGTGGGNFTDPGVGDLGSSVFGWGTAIFDYDNDGDQDIVYHGGMDATDRIILDNPGVLLQNENCSANFELDAAAITADHNRRSVRGLAIGDLDRNGFADIVTVADVVAPASRPLLPSPVSFGTVFDATAFYVAIFDLVFPPGGEPGLVWNGVDTDRGDLAVELNSGGNGNDWVSVTLVGSIGLTPQAQVNRDGIGAVVAFTPKNGKTVIKPILGGSSHLSQNSLETIFGLGQANKGTVEVLWPGGVRNRLYDVHQEERIHFPEIPCSFDGNWATKQEYKSCVQTALNDLVAAGVISPNAKGQFLSSALKAFNDQ